MTTGINVSAELSGTVTEEKSFMKEGKKCEVTEKWPVGIKARAKIKN